MNPATDFPWSGERFVPGVRGETEIEHLHRYALAALLAPGRRVLDVACGEGYGACLLAKNAESVVGIDLDAAVIAHANKKYALPNLKFVQGNCCALPLHNASMDLIVSFETLEHHANHEMMMAEFHRVLSPKGVLLISTPDRLYYSDERNLVNPFHVRELYADEFRQMLERHFAHTNFYGQRIVYGSLMASLDQAGEFVSFSGDCNHLTESQAIAKPLYLIAIASSCSLPALPSSLFDSTLALMQEMSALRQELAEASGQLNAVYDSTYWRIAAPWRMLRKGLRWAIGKLKA